MNAPAAIVMSKIIIPESNKEGVVDTLEINAENEDVNLIDAMSRGAGEGLKLALNVGAMLLAFIAVIAALNYLLSDVIGAYSGLNALILETTNGQFQGFSLEYILGQIFRIFAFLS